VPVTVGGLVIQPGDIIVGDEDGLVALPPTLAEEVLGAARRQAAREAQALKDIAAGTFDRAWVDAALQAKGVLPG